MRYDELNQLFRDELSTYYPPEEIRAIIRALAAHYEQLSLITLHLFADKQISDEVLSDYLKALEMLKKHVPLQYITEEVWFMDLKLHVNSHVLIPRPETEELVNLLIEAQPAPGGRILDLCTGSGCIALAVAYYCQQTRVWATDISTEALKVAKGNAEMNKLQVNFFQADVLKNFPEDLPKFNWILSNPPYIPQDEASGMALHVTAFEPHEALFVGNDDPLLFYKAIRDHAEQLLEPNGGLILECHEHFAHQVASLFKQVGFASVEVIADLAGKSRFVKAVKPD